MAKNTSTPSTATTVGADKQPIKAAEPKVAASVLETKPVEAKAAASVTAAVPVAKTPATSTIKETATKTRAKPPVKKAKVEESKPEVEAAPKRTVARAGKPKTAKSVEPSQAEIDGMIAEAAYYLAERRNFMPGFEAEDWELARAQVLGRIAEAKAGS